MKTRRLMFVASACRALRWTVTLGASQRRTRRQRVRKEPQTKRGFQTASSLCLPTSGVRNVRFLKQHTAAIDFVGFGEREVDTRLLSQRDDEEAWLAARRALVVTASQFRNLGAPELRKQVQDTAGMRWGRARERAAIEEYARDKQHAVYATGLWTDPTCRFGASPDGVVYDANTNETGLLEVKCLWSRRFKKTMPQWQHCPERFLAQVQGQLLVCDDMAFCDLVAWIPRNSRAPNYTVVRVRRDPAYHDALLHKLHDFFLLQEEAQDDEDHDARPRRPPLGGDGLSHNGDGEAEVMRACLSSPVCRLPSSTSCSNESFRVFGSSSLN